VRLKRKQFARNKAGRFVRKGVRAGIKSSASEHNDSSDGGPEYTPPEFDELDCRVELLPPPQLRRSETARAFSGLSESFGHEMPASVTLEPPS
jgi:hypothetical protein